MKKLIESIIKFFNRGNIFPHKTKKVVSTPNTIPDPSSLSDWDYNKMSPNAKRLYRLVELENNLETLNRNIDIIKSIDGKSNFDYITIHYRSPIGYATVYVTSDNLMTVSEIAINSINLEISETEKEILEITQSY